jgi:DNA recombination protein RmuC
MLTAILVLVSIVGLMVLGVFITLLTRNPESKLLDFERAIRNEMDKNRGEATKSMKDLSGMTLAQVNNLTQMNEDKLNSIRNTLETRLKDMQGDNEKKLEQMRQTVDEKLHETLEKRLGDSFKIVSERLEKVHAGLGEMQNLALGVGDLKKVLSNVKTRGTWGEIQLGNLLEQILSPEQYDKNVATKKGSKEIVEYAIKMPGKSEDVVWLPIDAKFPKEDYERLLEAQEAGELKLVEEAGKALEARVKGEARDIRDKYIDPPNTTDFGIMFLSTEGLYAEALRRPGLAEFIQREYRVSLSGPSTVAALLNSLQMGFRTLAIEKRASEVWSVLGAVKTEFSKFGKLLERTHRQLNTVTKSIESATTKTRTIERKLRNVQELPTVEAVAMLEDSEDLEKQIEDLDGGMANVVGKDSIV